jgi:hypothetical protein
MADAGVAAAADGAALALQLQVPVPHPSPSSPRDPFRSPPAQQMTRMRDAAVQLLAASSAERDSLARHNQLLVLELEEARARVRVLQVRSPAIIVPRTRLRDVSCFFLLLLNALYFQHAVLSKLTQPGAKENMSPGYLESKTLAAAGRDFAPSTRQEQHQSSFTHSPAHLLPQPYPATPAPVSLPANAKSSLKRSQHRAALSAPSPAAAGDSGAIAASARVRPVTSPLKASGAPLSPLKASLVVQPAARVASPAKMSRVAAAAAVTAEQVARMALPLPPLHSPGHVMQHAEDNHHHQQQQQQQEATRYRQLHSDPPAVQAPPVPSPTRRAASSASHAAAAAAAAESASKLLRDLDSSGSRLSVDNGSESLGVRGARAAAPAGVTSREQLLLWMQVWRCGCAMRRADAVMQEVEAGVGDMSDSFGD